MNREEARYMAKQIKKEIDEELLKYNGWNWDMIIGWTVIGIFCIACWSVFIYLVAK